MKKDRLVAPWLRASMMYEQGLEQSGYYRKRTVREMGAITFTIWAIVIVMAVLALTMTSHHEEEMTNIIDKKEVVSRWDGAEDIGTAISRELWIMKEARNSAELIDRMYANK